MEFDKLLSKTWDKSAEGANNDVAKSNVLNINLDPRPDLSQDSILWQQLLAGSLDRDPSKELYSALVFMRTKGTVLRRIRTKDGVYMYALRPYFHLTDGWENINEYEITKRKVLDPVRDKLIELLKDM